MDHLEESGHVQHVRSLKDDGRSIETPNAVDEHRNLRHEAPKRRRASPAGRSTSNGALNKLGPQIQWIHSYVTDDKIYCIYNAPNETMVVEHAKLGGFPANRIPRVGTIINPTTAE